MDEFTPAGTYIGQPATGARPTFRLVAAAVGICALVAILAPPLSNDFEGDPRSLADAGSDVVVYVLAGMAVLAFAAFVVKSRAVAAGLIGGVAATFVGYFGLVDSVFYVIVDGLGDLGSDGGVGFGPGFWFALFAVVVGVVAVVMALNDRADDNVARLTGGWAGIGVCAGLATGLGVMLPPNDTEFGFAERNFEFGPALLQFAWLAFVASISLPAVVGFASRTRWGLGAAFGAFVPTAWLTVTAVTDDDNTFDDSSTQLFSFDNVHPVWPIAVAVQALALFLGYQETQRARAAGIDLPIPDTTPPHQRPPAPAPDAVAGMWAPDPYGRHRVRYHDGADWTATVADETTTIRDVAQHPAPPDVSPGGMWATDPFGRHRQRFHDGSRWTRHVADGAGVGTTDDATYPPPRPAAAEPGAADLDDVEVGYTTIGWSAVVNAAILDRFAAAGIGYELVDDEVIVAKRDEATADDIIADCTGDTVNLVESTIEVAYATTAWSDETVAEVSAALIADGIQHSFDDDEIVIDKSDEERADAIIADITVSPPPPPPPPPPNSSPPALPADRDPQ